MLILLVPNNKKFKSINIDICESSCTVRITTYFQLITVTETVEVLNGLDIYIPNRCLCMTLHWNVGAGFDLNRK